MKFPEIGQLNRRVTLFQVQHRGLSVVDVKENKEVIGTYWAKKESLGTTTYYNAMALGTNISHRFYLRYIAGKTAPHDLKNVVEIECEGVLYQVRRVNDLNESKRFTVLECQELGLENVEGEDGECCGVRVPETIEVL